MANDGHFVAIRKTPRLNTIGVDYSSTENKRTMIVSEASRSERVKRLEEIGLRNFDRPEDHFEPLPGDEPVFRRLGYIGGYVVNSPSEKITSEATDILGKDYFLLPNIALSLPQPPSDLELPKEIRSTRLRSDTDWPKITGIREAHDVGVTGLNVRVGVLDTGCDSDHKQFNGKVIDFLYVNPSDVNKSTTKRGFDPGEHGTHVCGIIAGENVGVAPDAELMVASVIESETAETSLERIMFALNWMLSKFVEERSRAIPTIINMSLGFRLDTVSQQVRVGVSVGMKALLSTLLHDFDVLPVVAIGNDGPGMVRAPGYFAEALSVGAVDFKHSAAHFSGGGPSPDDNTIQPDVVGYGINVYSSISRDRENRHWYGTKHGTSMATPYVTGIAALYACANPTLQGNALKYNIVRKALPLQESSDRVGAGLARFVP